MDRIVMVRGFARGGPVRPTRLIVSAGGSGVHAGRVAHLLGARVTAHGFFGGAIGSRVIDLAQAEGLSVSPTDIVGENRVNYVIVDEGEGYRMEIPEPGPSITPAEVTALVGRFAAEVGSADIVVLSSGLPPGCPPDIYQELVAATPPGIPVVVDAHSEALRHAWAASPTWVKTNEDEFRGLCEHAGIAMPAGPLPIEEVPRLVAALGSPRPRHAVVTLGGRGAVVVTESAAWFASPPPVEAVNPSGSGDAFVGALAVGIAGGMTTPDVVRLATAAGTANARYLEVGYCLPEDLDELLPVTSATVLPGIDTPSLSPTTRRDN